MFTFFYILYFCTNGYLIYLTMLLYNCAEFTFKKKKRQDTKLYVEKESNILQLTENA